MGTSAPFTFIILKISHFYVSKNYNVKHIDRYIQEECMKKKGPIENTLYFGKYKKDKFLIVNISKVVAPPIHNTLR
jgi:hypothetical protein